VSSKGNWKRLRHQFWSVVENSQNVFGDSKKEKKSKDDGGKKKG